MLDHQGAQNFLNQIPTKATHPTGVELWFKKPFSEHNPMRVYLIECKENSANYEDMKTYLVEVFSGNNEWVRNFEKSYGRRGIQNLYTTTKCKREIRRAVGIEYAMHINDDHDETVDMGDIVFNENSIDCLRYSDPKKVKSLANFNTLTSLIKEKLGKSIENVVIYNSAVLSAFGIRDCSDIDFLHDPRVPILANMHPLLSNQNQFFKRNYVILEDFYGKHYILEDIPDALSSINLDQETPSLRKKISIDDLLYNPHYYFHFHNLKFATLEFMHYFKEKRGRDKDRKDVQLMQEHFSNRAL